MKKKTASYFISVSVLAMTCILSRNAAAGLLFNRQDAGPEVEVKVEKSPTADFLGYKTYNWIPGVEKRTLDPRLRDSELDQRVREFVDRELQACGYQKANYAEPDFWVGYYAVIESGVDTETVRTHIGGPTSRDVMRGTSWPRETEVKLSRYYDQGTLVLDLIDAGENKLIWRASAKAEVQQKVDLETRRARLGNAVTKMMASVPQKQGNERIHEEIYRMQAQQDAIRETHEERRDSR